jgi:tetratricopeptide (TPR) repeat protein
VAETHGLAYWFSVTGTLLKIIKRTAVLLGLVAISLIGFAQWRASTNPELAIRREVDSLLDEASKITSAETNPTYKQIELSTLVEGYVEAQEFDKAWRVANDPAIGGFRSSAIQDIAIGFAKTGRQAEMSKALAQLSGSARMAAQSDIMLALFDMGRIEAAEKFAANSSDTSLVHAFHAHKATYLAKIGKLDDAQQELRKIGNPRSIAIAGGIIAEECRKQRPYPAGNGVIQQMQEAVFSSPASYEKIMALQVLIRTYMKAGNPLGAIDPLNEICKTVKELPKQPRSQYCLIEAYAAMGDIKRALELADEEGSPNESAEGQLRLVMELLKSDRTKEAAVVSKTIKNNSKRDLALCRVAIKHARNGKYDKARTFLSLLKDNTTRLSGQGVVAQVAATCNRPDRAWEFLTPSDDGGYDPYAIEAIFLQFGKQNDPNRARGYMEFLNVDADKVTALVNLAKGLLESLEASKNANPAQTR